MNVVGTTDPDLGFCGPKGPCDIMRLALAPGWGVVAVTLRKWLYMTHRPDRPLEHCPWCGNPVTPRHTEAWPWTAMLGKAAEAQADGAP